MTEQDIYQRNGYANRREYLESLAANFGVDMDVVLTLASALGPNEDFDGLVSELEDYEYLYGE
jgi:hypothetical protein